MARYTGSACRLCRREENKLFLKGERCYSDKCALERRPYPPGQHGQRRRGKVSDYRLQLREKQKVKRIYGLVENQFRLYYEQADKGRGVTGHALLVLLERRLDSVVTRLGFSVSRNQGRLLVRQGHVLVNNHKVNIPSYLVKANDVVEIREKSRQLTPVLSALETVERRPMPQWLALDKAGFKGTVLALPTREDITTPIQEKLIIELYSK